MSGCREEGVRAGCERERPFLPPPPRRPRAGGWLWEPPSSPRGAGSPTSSSRLPAIFAGGQG